MSSSATTLYRGSWWLPNAKDKPVPGTLAVEFGGPIRLELVGGFEVVAWEAAGGTPGRYNPRSTTYHPVIHGQSGSYAFTLFECMIVSSSQSVPRQVSEQTISIQRAARGFTWIEDDDYECMRGVHIQMDYLLHWSAMTTLADDYTRENGKIVGSWASAAPAETRTVSWGAFTFTLGVSNTDFNPSYSNPNARVETATEYAYIDIESSGSVSVKTLNEMARRMQDLLSLSMDRPCGIRAMSYWRHLQTRPLSGDNINCDERETFEAYSDQTHKPSVEADVGALYKALMTLFDAPFDVVVPLWLKLYERVRVGAQLLVGLRDGRYNSAKLMTVCTAVETIHVGLYDHRLMDTDKFDAILAEALRGVADSAHQRFVEDRLNNTVGYRARAKELARKVDPLALKALVGRVGVWADVLTEHRNNLAHEGYSQSTLELEYFLMVVTRGLLNLVIGVELGLDAEAQLRYVQKYWYQSERFKKRTGQISETSSAGGARPGL